MDPQYTDHNHLEQPHSSKSSKRQLLVDRANQLIEKYNLPVPRFVSTRFINFDFWANVFVRVFGIKCGTSLRTPSDRTEALQTGINTLSSLIGQRLDHIKATQLMHFDLDSMCNLLQIAELWEESFRVDRHYDQTDTTEDTIDIDYNHQRNIDENFNLIDSDHSTTSSGPSSADSGHFSKSQELASQLYKALSNQSLAIEIEKKIKKYFGDVTVTSVNDSALRSSRQSIVRTRAIQPSTSTFDYTFHRRSKLNQVFSVELEKLFPELSGQMIAQIRQQEQSLLMSERNIRIWQENLSMNKVMRSLNGAITQQRQRIDMLERELKQSETANRAKKERVRQIELKRYAHEIRSQKAMLQKNIDKFYNESTAAYLNARSYLEQILMLEFRKLDAHKRQQIGEIRKYLRNHYETETEKLRTLLDNFDSMFDN